MNAKSSTPRATPRHRSPRAARLMSFSIRTAWPRRAPSAQSRIRPVLEARDVRREVDAARADVDCARHAEHDAVECLLRRAGCRAEAKPRGRRSPRARRRPSARAARCPGAPGSHRARRRPHRGRSARRGRARARTPPPAPARRTSRRSSGRRPPAPPRGRDLRRAGTAGPARPLASRSRPGGRSPPARSGAEARIASSTVRSFRSLSSGGVARPVGH